MAPPLSSRAAEVLDFIVDHIDAVGFPPTVLEIGAAVGISSPSTVQGHLDRLVDDEYIERRVLRSPRALRVLRYSDGTVATSGNDA